MEKSSAQQKSFLWAFGGMWELSLQSARVRLVPLITAPHFAATRGQLQMFEPRVKYPKLQAVMSRSKIEKTMQPMSFFVFCLWTLYNSCIQAFPCSQERYKQILKQQKLVVLCKTSGSFLNQMWINFKKKDIYSDSKDEN